MYYQNAIELIISFKKNFEKIDIDPDKRQKIPAKLMSELGELYVLQKLSQRFKDVVPKGGAKSYDINVGGKRIEVKTSTFKKDRLFRNQIPFWGWTVKSTSQKKENRFDFLIGVALDDSWTKPEFYIFSYEDAFTNNTDVKMPGYSNVQKKICIFRDERDFSLADNLYHNQLTDQERHINCNIKKFKNAWTDIKIQNDPMI